MESLAEETWDVVIAGTGLVQALLALSLSRSDLKILHVDENSFYGGVDAGLSLDEAKAWADKHGDASGLLSLAEISLPSTSDAKLASSRSYTLSLNPQIVYAQSRFLPSLVASTVNTQLEFMAVGSWWICRQGKLQKVPSSREDVFADDELSRRDKIGLMKFIRRVVQESSEGSEPQDDVQGEESLHAALSSRFRISANLQLPISALALAQQSVHDTSVEEAVPRIRRHMTSVGYFGPGFGAVLAKYAGNAEIAQVCCRACAVGGGTYLLGHGVSTVTTDDSNGSVGVELTDGTSIKARHLISSLDNLPKDFVDQIRPQLSSTIQTYHYISIVSSPLRHLFPQTSENGPIPAAAIVLLTDVEDADVALTKPPIYLQLHTEDTGECPAGQCIIYGSILINDSNQTSAVKDRLASAIQRFLDVATTSDNSISQASSNDSVPEILWSMSYVSIGTSQSEASTMINDQSGRVLIFPPPKPDIAFDDSVLDSVNSVWKKVLGDKADGVEFLRFENRSGDGEMDD